RDKAVLRDLLSGLCRDEPRTRAAIDAEVSRLNEDPDAMDALIDQQNYRLALWRMASRDVGYRRFFDIKELAGLRVEDIEVFRDAHALPMTWVEKGWVQGLRIDHPDGLRDPGQYFRRLREACPNAWIVAEKILASDETLPSQWPISGTTGYDFLNRVGGLFIDAESEGPLTRIYEDFIGESTDFPALVRTCKRLVLSDLLGSELNRLTSLFVDVCERHRRHRDYTRHELREALRETAVCFPVYRSYVSVSDAMPRQQDQGYIVQAVGNAMSERTDLDPQLFSFLQELLLLRIEGALEAELAMRFQQLTGPAMAKGVEDTAFYRYHRLIALNEVGGDPSRFGVSLQQFHDACAATRTQHPATLLASSTHYTKRSEDVRSRLALLSEIPDRWSREVSKWRDLNECHRKDDLPDRNTEYLLYQTLVGTWPIDVERVMAYMEKAVREAKSYTSWTAQDEAYEERVREFTRGVMGNQQFQRNLDELVADLVVPGRINSLAGTLIKLTAPGVPDIYQGTELWDLSLVDPDNRRAVDYELRRRLLEDLPGLSPQDILARSDEGLPKLWVIRQALQLRRARPEAFGAQAAYRPLFAQGEKAKHVVAFARGEGVICVAPRLVLQLNGDWGDTVLDLPAGRWRNILGGDEMVEGAVHPRELLAPFPVGLLVKNE
ncbi:MAG: malto-oligosyltrehalose synthase, partial [Planctomycetota bacterium]